MSLLLAGLVVAGTSGAVMVGRWIKKRLRPSATAGEDGDSKTSDGDADEKAARKELDDDLPAPKDDDTPPPREPTREKAKEKRVAEGSRDRVRLDGFICQLGDVVMRLTGEEAWLAGGVVLSEQVPVAVLFVAPDAGHDCVIYVRARPSDRVTWLEPLDPKEILVGGEPPSSVEHGGIRFERARRLPLRPRRIGVGGPDTGDAVIVAEYNSSGAERLLVMKANSGNVFAYRGLELEAGSFEVIASGDATL